MKIKKSSRIIYGRIVIIMLMAINFLITVQLKQQDIVVNAKTNEVVEQVNTGYIYTGDSRIRRLNLTIKMKNMKRNWVYCKSGMGYSWFVNNSIPEINRTMTNHPEINNWVIVSGWGVNDLGNINAYISKYKELLNGKWSNCRLYLMSVNPVGGNLRAKYSRIGSFNNSLKAYVNNSKSEDGNLFYIDTNAAMVRSGYSTIDGLHYSESTNRLIYSVVRERLDTDYARFNYDNLNINKNAIKTLIVNEVNRKIKWTSSDNRIVKVGKTSGLYRQKALIKARNEGCAVITADCGVKKLKCKINVTNNKILVAYFSYSGSSEYAAEYIHDNIGGDLFEIDPIKVYSNYKNKFDNEITQELEQNVRPDLLRYIKDMDQYDTIILGFPIWKGFAPRPVCTFVEKYNWSNKTVIPFCTSEELSFGGSINELKTLMPNAVFNKGLCADNEDVYNKSGRTEINEWLDRYFEN